ncbi:hypothetical protein Fmac_031915 [Flemingia macrophylla]|uniref:Uncharacterized protein n=1 Tax=Flemingia macrophylla TaxID=520843 RepID=A0ABD1L3F0_9FABA
MASPPENSDITFPPVDVVGELNPGTNTHIQVDPTSSEVAAYNKMKEQNEAKQKKSEGEKKDTLQTIKSAIIISGIVVALAGAAFAITKKLREK